MRPFSVRFFACVLALAAMATSARAQWREFSYPELGVAISFPAQPTRASRRYETQVVGADPASAEVLTVTHETIVYTLTVVDLRAPEHVAKSANILAECVFLAEAEGQPLVNVAQHAPDGSPQPVHGRAVSVDTANTAGRKETACFYTRGRLYKIEALVPIGYGEPDTPLALMFTESIRFDLGR
jgi:hypothetical protein